MPATIRTVVVDDNRLVRDGLAALLASQSGFKVVAAVGTAKSCLDAVAGDKVHVVLVDAQLGKASSRHLIAEIRDRAPEARTIVMDLMPAEQDIIDFVKAGANGFVVKDATIEEMVTTIRAVAKGGSVIPPVLTGTLLTHIAAQAAVLPDAVEAGG